MLALLSLPAALALTCEGYGAPALLAEVADGPIAESSGLAYARSRPGVWFTHDDSGGAAEIYAFDLDGVYLGSHAVQGATAGDWEDMAAGPCPGGGDCLYIGDIGDNFHVRAFVTVYAVPEPREGRSAQVLATWNVRYPDGQARDSEALLVHPRTGEIALVTKEDADTCGIYRLPAEPTDDGELELVATLSLPGTGGARTATGADWDPDGDRVVVRTYTTALEWSADPCDPDTAWAGEPTAWATADGQGEAIAYDTEGDLITSSEGNPMVLKRLACSAVGEGSGPCDSGQDDSGPGGAFFQQGGDGCGCGVARHGRWVWLLGVVLLAWRRSR